MLSPYPRSAEARLLLGIREAPDGVLRFPGAPGIWISLQARSPLEDQLRAAAAPFAATDLMIAPDFAETLPGDAILYLATATGTSEALTLPEWLRQLPKDRQRLPLLKAWQYLAGTHREMVKALFAEDVLGRD